MSNHVWTSLENLIVVACHAVYKAEGFADPLDDGAWALQDFQKGEPRFYIQHIRSGVDHAARDGRALLVFSGGQTRAEAGPRSEAQGYWRLAEHFGWWGHAVGARATTEEFARDSFENLLFGICRFYECAGRFPRLVTVVGWAFKGGRFELHARALRLPVGGFQYVGVNYPADRAAAVAAERADARRHFAHDPYGAQPPLADKRAARNPFKRHPPYAASCPALAPLINHRGPELFDGELPW